MGMTFQSLIRILRRSEPEPVATPTRIQVSIDLSRIHDSRHQGPIGYFGYSWEENAGIGIMNQLIAAGIPMDWRHFIGWCGDRLAAEGYRPTRGRLTFNKDPDFTVRDRVQITWIAD
jgi:hypothetical protein